MAKQIVGNKSLQLLTNCKISVAYLSKRKKHFKSLDLCHEKDCMFMCSQNYKKENKQD